MSDRELALNSLISHEFFKAALLPLLVIGIALVVLYFSVNAYNLRNSGECLKKECISHIQ